jgi:hypothetical protein
MIAVANSLELQSQLDLLRSGNKRASSVPEIEDAIEGAPHSTKLLAPIKPGFVPVTIEQDTQEQIISLMSQLIPLLQSHAPGLLTSTVAATLPTPSLAALTATDATTAVRARAASLLSPEGSSAIVPKKGQLKKDDEG